MVARLTAQHKKDFEENGCFIIENVLTTSEVEQIKSKVMEIAQLETEANAAHYYDENGDAQRIWNLLNKDQLFRDIIQRPIILEIMEWIFDRATPHQKYYLSSLQANILRPNAKKMKLHIDTPVPEPLPDWVIKANTIWILDDFTSTNGATEYLAGSHKSKYKPTAEDQSRTDLTVATPSAGSVMVIHGALWHRAGENRSSQTRSAILGSFAASYAREIANEENYTAILDKSVVENASDNLRKILGPEHGIRPGSQNAMQKK